MKQAKVRYNYNDYLLLPEDKRYEILDGELHLNPAPNIKHQRISRDLGIALAIYVKSKNLGEILDAPCDVILSEEDVVQPDILFVRKERAGITGEANIRGAPDLAVEILSAGTRSRDLELKRKTYARFGIREYWIVDPDAETVEVLVWRETGYERAAIHSKSGSISSLLFPDLCLPLNEVFA